MKIADCHKMQNSNHPMMFAISLWLTNAIAMGQTLMMSIANL